MEIFHFFHTDQYTELTAEKREFWKFVSLHLLDVYYPI